MAEPASTALPIIDFPPFRLDLRAEQLRRDAVPVPLRPKTFAVLQFLAQRPGQLVTKRALLDAVWGNVAVSEDVVRLSVGELRVALGEERTAPRFIETVPRRGYRFTAEVGTLVASPALRAGEAATHGPLTDDSSAVDGLVVGRDNERAEIAEWFRAVANGRRQIGFVTGEPGIGKTTLVEAVIRDMRRTAGARLRIARGQCVEHYGGGEPYLPVLEALSSLCRGSDEQTVKASLRDHAPNWLLGVMGVPAPADVDRTEPSAGNHEHTLPKLVATLDALAAEIPFVLVLEDVQWCDYSTLDLLSVVARRRESARLLVLCTLRPADAIVRGHPIAGVKRELRRQGLCREILLDGLTAVEVGSYLVARFAGAQLPEDLPALLVERSEGNPFFLGALVDHLLGQGLLAESGSRREVRGDIETLRTVIPDGLRAVIEPRLERLTVDEFRMLEAASVAGLGFAARTVASVVPNGGGDVESVERLCDGLVRRQEILCAAGNSGRIDGTASARYTFRHALYRQVIYQGLSPSTRRRLHQAVGEALESEYDGGTREGAAQLAIHFERSGDVDRAVHFRSEAAARARSRSAYQEAVLHLEAALDLMRSQPETPERLRREILILHDLGSTLFAIKGYGDERAARAFARMRVLAERLDDASMQLRAMDSLLLVYTMRAESTAARALGEEMIVLAEQLGNTVAAASARLTLGAWLMSVGEIRAARRYAGEVRSLLATASPPGPSVLNVSSCCLLASACAHLGLTARARAMTREAHAHAVKLGIPYFRAQTTNFAAQVCTVLRDVTGARALAEEVAQLADEYGFAIFRMAATMVLGWCDVEDGRVAEGLAALRGAFDGYAATGQRFSTTFFGALLAEAHLVNGNAAAANEVVDRSFGLAAEMGEHLYESELYRLRGECLLYDTTIRRHKANALQCFELALAVASEKKSLLFELRAATSLCRVRKSARERLSRLVDRFGAGDDCPDLEAARALLGC